MTGSWHAGIRLVYALDRGGSPAIDTIRNGDPFEVIAEISIGRSLMQVVTGCVLAVSVRNLSQSRLLAREQLCYPLVAQDAALRHRLAATVDGGWSASEGDVLEVLATFKVTAGVHRSYSLARSAPFIVAC
jgi:hypothetical protein